MKRLLSCLLLVGLLTAAKDEVTFERMPEALSNNAVAMHRSGGTLFLVSFMGLGAKKTWDSVTNETYSLDTKTGEWSKLRPVPGTAGRLAASAVNARDHIFLFGGYVVDHEGGESTVGDVNVYEPLTDRWYRGEDIPVPVSASVAGVYRDRFIYLVSGWGKNGAPVNNVQMYNAEKNEWKQATPIPGNPVFGHAGAVVNDTIVYVDGAYKNPSGSNPAYIASEDCWMGKIDRHDPSQIQWTKLPPHPGAARFRLAAGGSDKDDRIYFTGGSATPYTTAGNGFDGNPATPSPTVFAFNLRSGKWETITDNLANPTMDQRGVLVTSAGLILLGGMNAKGAVSAAVTVLPKQASK